MIITHEDDLKKNNEKLEKLDDKKLEKLSDEELEKVSGGSLTNVEQNPEMKTKPDAPKIMARAGGE